MRGDTSLFGLQRRAFPLHRDSHDLGSGRLLEVVKDVYGLPEAPRLWYLKARNILIRIGFIELRCARAAFVFFNTAKRLVSMLNLHVGDGLFFRRPE